MFLTEAKLSKKTRPGTSAAAAFLIDVKLRLEALALSLLWMGCRLLGPERASVAGARLIGLLSPPGGKTMRRLRRNLRIALPDQDDATIDHVAGQSLANLGRAIAEYPHLRHIAGPELPGFIEFAADIPEAALTPDRPPAIYVGVHQANWEILSSIAAPLGKPMTIVVSTLTNPYVHRLIGQARPDVWVEQSEKDQATRQLIRCLQEGRSVGLLADQRFEGGEVIPFFGHLAKTAVVPARLAIKFGCDLVPTRIERSGKAGFKITTFKAIRPDASLANDHERAIDMMCRVNRHFEAWIREKPGEWMCMKRRWDKQVYDSLNIGPAETSTDSKGLSAPIAARY